MSVQQIYDFEGVIEAAAASVFVAAGLVCFTPQSDPAFQKERPRVEAIFVPGSSLRRCQIVNSEGATLEASREVAWKGRLQIEAITDSVIATHAAYRAKVRNVMAKFAATVNGVNLTRHAILFPISDLGSSPTYKTSEGFYATVMNYEFNFSVQADAWGALNT